MAETQSLAREHTAGLIFILENLGFIINNLKSLLTPTQEIEFLGFSVNTVNLEIKLPGEKSDRKPRDCMQEMQNPPALDLSRLLGKLNHTMQAIPPAPLFYRNLQQCLQTTYLGGGGGGGGEGIRNTPPELT